MVPESKSGNKNDNKAAETVYEKYKDPFQERELIKSELKRFHLVKFIKIGKCRFYCLLC